jgi:EAL domain-containing protein (putative c-di-GMP-specific phosphodiesterase class I)
VLIPIAEKTKHIIQPGEEIFRRTFRSLRKPGGSGFDDINVSFNVFLILLPKPGYSAKLMIALQELGICPEGIGMAITKPAFSSNQRKIIRVMMERKRGACICPLTALARAAPLSPGKARVRR